MSVIQLKIDLNVKKFFLKTKEFGLYKYPQKFFLEKNSIFQHEIYLEESRSKHFFKKPRVYRIEVEPSIL